MEKNLNSIDFTYLPSLGCLTGEEIQSLLVFILIKEFHKMNNYEMVSSINMTLNNITLHDLTKHHITLNKAFEFYFLAQKYK